MPGLQNRPQWIDDPLLNVHAPDRRRLERDADVRLPIADDLHDVGRADDPDVVADLRVIPLEGGQCFGKGTGDDALYAADTDVSALQPLQRVDLQLRIFGLGQYALSIAHVDFACCSKPHPPGVTFEERSIGVRLEYLDVPAYRRCSYI